MPYQFDFDATNKIARCRVTGRVTDDELKECYEKIADFMALTDPRAAIMDTSQVTAFEVSRDVILQLASRIPALPHPERIRVIVAPNPLIFGMSRMFGMEGERTRPNFHVVRTQQEASAILGVWEPKFEPYQ